MRMNGSRSGTHGEGTGVQDGSQMLEQPSQEALTPDEGAGAVPAPFTTSSPGNYPRQVVGST